MGVWTKAPGLLKPPTNADDKQLNKTGPLGALQRTWVALLLTWVGGFVDFIGYEYLYGIYTANMTGNSVRLARSISESHAVGVARYGFTIGVFVAAVIFGSIVFEAEHREVLRLRCPGTLLGEAAAIGIFLVVVPRAASFPSVPHQPATSFYLLVALLATAMGLQNVTIRKVGGITVYTSFVTGTLIKFAENATVWLFWMRDRTRHRFFKRILPALRISVRRAEPQRAALTAGLWFCYVGGAIAAFFARRSLNVFSLIFPLGVVTALTIYGAIWPFMHVEETEW